MDISRTPRWQTSDSSQRSLHCVPLWFLSVVFLSTGRTFPTHPYFSVQLGAGQLSLFNLLKAYSLLDKEVGYCQGISFVAGVLLLHMSEEQAFEMLKFLMYDLGFRKQYRPDMMSLQVRQWLVMSQVCRRLSSETLVPAISESQFRVQEI